MRERDGREVEEGKVGEESTGVEGREGGREGIKVKERIVLSEIHLRTTGRHLSMGSHSVICQR